MTTLIEAEAERLEAVERRISGWQDLVLKAAEDETIDPAIVGRLGETIERLVTLDGELNEEDFDARSLAELRRLLIKLIGIVSAIDDRYDHDQLDAALVTLEGMRHIIRDALDWHVHGVVENAPDEVVASIYAALPSTRRADVAELAGISPRHLQRLAKGEGETPRRLSLVARLVALLQRGWNEDGIVAWFHRARPELSGATPADLLSDPASEHDLLMLARGGRSQHG